jgi:DnaJ-class molecular chaperone
MTNFKKIHEARKTLGLGEDATLGEIKEAYKRLTLRYHPDRCKDDKKKECEEMFKKITHANDVLMAYCAGYRYSFKEKDIRKNTMDKETYEHLKRFYDGWLGDLDL